MGRAGTWIDGVSWYNPLDSYSYNNLGVWNRNANYWEFSSLDACYGHPAPTSYDYHIHVSIIYFNFKFIFIYISNKSVIQFVCIQLPTVHIIHH
jgi:hypothetical protein